MCFFLTIGGPEAEAPTAKIIKLIAGDIDPLAFAFFLIPNAAAVALT